MSTFQNTATWMLCLVVCDAMLLKELDIDNAREIMGYLSIEDNSRITRRINRNLNSIYIHHYNETLRIINKIQFLSNAICHKQNNVTRLTQEIGLLHRSNNLSLWLNKDYLLIMPQVINKAFGTKLVFNSVSVEEYARERKAELGDFLGTIIAGIYEGIRNGANDLASDYEKASGRPHKSPEEMIELFKSKE